MDTPLMQFFDDSLVNLQLSHARLTVSMVFPPRFGIFMYLFISRSIAVLDEDFEHQSVLLTILGNVDGTAPNIAFVEDAAIFFPSFSLLKPF
ncbi:MAG TPA: hypothetical protein DHU75_01250 [Rikenellaceae bacterium]|nr:hypothetical protein [uncultured Prevotella sp.]HCY72794.1 hypothetical protein [Rikenellaceae bacterium]